MRKPPTFFVTTLSILLFLSLACTACGRNTVYSSAGTAPSPARDPVTQVYALAWAPDGARLALGTKNGDIQVWNTRSKTLLLTAEQRFGAVYALAWSPDGKLIASVGGGSIVQLWHATTGKQIALLHVRRSRGEGGRARSSLLSCALGFHVATRNPVVIVHS